MPASRNATATSRSILNRALESGRVSLGRGDVRALVAVLEQEQDGRFGPAAAELLRAVA